MSAPFLGQIAIFGFQFAPQGWAFCQGQMLAIAQNVPLFEILSNTYGGNGQSNFALPNLQGIPVGVGEGPGRSNYNLGQAGGDATVTLTPQQMPSHSHAFNAVTNQATSASPQGQQLAKAWKAQAKTDSVASFYSDNPGNAKTALAPNAIGPSGSDHPHNNMQPYLTLNYCIALRGDFPPRN
jgi:microcystin-dependent protein